MSGPMMLAFETSCDETAAAVVEGRKVLSNVLSSQVEAHARFGGVVPEVAARAHVEAIRSLTHRALGEAGVHPDDLDGIAATRGPGLAGSLLVGFSFAKAVAWSKGIPFIGVDHMEGHLFAPRLEFEDFRPPAVVLLASGGHSQVVLVRGWGDYRVLGETIDDAAGEAFDKLARFMGLGFPGGPAIDALSEGGDPEAMRFPRALAGRRRREDRQRDRSRGPGGPSDGPRRLRLHLLHRLRRSESGRLAPRPIATSATVVPAGRVGNRSTGAATEDRDSHRSGPSVRAATRRLTAPCFGGPRRCACTSTLVSTRIWGTTCGSQARCACTSTLVSTAITRGRPRARKIGVARGRVRWHNRRSILATSA